MRKNIAHPDVADARPHVPILHVHVTRFAVQRRMASPLRGAQERKGGVLVGQDPIHGVHHVDESHRRSGYSDSRRRVLHRADFDQTSAILVHHRRKLSALVRIQIARHEVPDARPLSHRYRIPLLATHAHLGRTDGSR